VEGLLRKSKNRETKGFLNVALTEKGQQIHNQSLKSESIEGIMSCLSEEERGQLEPSLKRLQKKALNLAALRGPPFP